MIDRVEAILSRLGTLRRPGGHFREVSLGQGRLLSVDVFQYGVERGHLRVHLHGTIMRRTTPPPVVPSGAVAGCSACQSAPGGRYPALYMGPRGTREYLASSGTQGRSIWRRSRRRRGGWRRGSSGPSDVSRSSRATSVGSTRHRGRARPHCAATSSEPAWLANGIPCTARLAKGADGQIGVSRELDVPLSLRFTPDETLR